MFRECAAWGGSLKASGYSGTIVRALRDGVLTDDNVGCVVFTGEGYWHVIEHSNRFKLVLFIQKLEHIVFICDTVVILALSMVLPVIFNWLYHRQLGIGYLILAFVLAILFQVLLLLLDNLDCIAYLCIRKEHAIPSKCCKWYGKN